MKSILRLTCRALGAVVLTVGVVQAAEPVATVGTNWSDVELKLMSVTRKGSVLTVKWDVTNGADEKNNVFFVFKGKDPCYVIDEENGTKYHALTDQKGNAIASGNSYVAPERYGAGNEIAPGGTRRYWMKLAAPPPEVSEVTVFLTETEPLEGVAILDK